MQDAAASVAPRIWCGSAPKYGGGTVKAQNPSAYRLKRPILPILPNSREGGWHAEADDNFPMTLADRRDADLVDAQEFPPRFSRRFRSSTR